VNPNGYTIEALFACFLVWTLNFSIFSVGYVSDVGLETLKQTNRKSQVPVLLLLLIFWALFNVSSLQKIEEHAALLCGTENALHAMIVQTSERNRTERLVRLFSVPLPITRSCTASDITIQLERWTNLCVTFLDMRSPNVVKVEYSILTLSSWSFSRFSNLIRHHWIKLSYCRNIQL
jgi:hypothetical protein